MIHLQRNRYDQQTTICLTAEEPTTLCRVKFGRVKFNANLKTEDKQYFYIFIESHKSSKQFATSFLTQFYVNLLMSGCFADIVKCHCKCP